MGIRIFCNKKEILHSSRSFISQLYLGIEETIYGDENYCLNERLENLIDAVWLAQSGIGFDLANHLKDKADLILFAKIIEKTIENACKEEHFKKHYKEKALNFHKEILLCADEQSK